MAGSGDNKGGMGFHHRDERAVNCQSSGMSTGPFFPSTWDSVVSIGHHDNFVGSSLVSQNESNGSPYTVALENHGISSTSCFAHYPADSSFIEMVPKHHAFGSVSLSEIVSSVGLTDCSQMASIGCPPNNTSNREGKNGSSARNHDDRRFSDGTTTLALPYGKKRKCGVEFRSLPDQDAGGMAEHDFSAEISDIPEDPEEKKQNLKSKVKQVKDNTGKGEAPEENYMHVRARRGQATNSHSLAERVRREKISERMRMLQELVPGCNKITGKAVMLDEIINYVQSLQQQVEFLSMKLATFSPELNIDIERILSKDILRSRGGNAAVLGFIPGMNSQSSYSPGLLPAGIRVIPDTNHQILPSPHMGFSSSSAVDILGANGNMLTGHLKPER